MRPCPFCRATPDKLALRGDRAARWVHCRGCGANGPTSSGFTRTKTLQDRFAVTLWDTAPRGAKGEG